MMNSLSLTMGNKTIVNSIRQRGDGKRSIYLYTNNNKIRSTMLLSLELSLGQTENISVLKADKNITSFCILTHYFDHKFSNFRSVLF